MQPQNTIIGDATGIDLPVSDLKEEELIEEKKMAQYFKSAEFKRIQEHFEAKVAYYQQFLPGGIPPETITDEERGKYWAVANILIKEFREVIDMYQNASEVVEKLNKDG